MTIKEQIYEHIRRFFGSDKEIFHEISKTSIPGKVISVNETERSCIVEPINGDSQRKARIQCSLNIETGIFIKPVKDSFVMLSYINHEAGFISLYSEIEKLIIKIGKSELEIIDGTITLNGGELGGLTKTKELKSNLDSLNTYISTLQNATYAIAGALDALIPGTSIAFNSTMQTAILPTYKNIENEKIKQ